MTLRKYLNHCYQLGWDDGHTDRRPAFRPPATLPVRLHRPYGRWAYDAGHRDGRQDLQRYIQAAKRIIETGQGQ